MKILTLIKYLILCLLCYTAKYAGAQQKLVMSGGYINIANGATLVIGNSATDAITRNTGSIITEGENNIVKWNTGTTTGTYTIPLGYGTDYIPLTFTKTAGTGNGYFAFSSYHTGWDNAAMLPTGVLNVNYNGADNSSFTIDRFWKIDAGGYTSKPALTNLTFTYIDAEHSASGNSITEGQLGAQRWNSDINDWGDFIPGVSIDVTNNKVTVSNVTGANLYKWWTLPGLNGNHFLPVELTAFSGECINGTSTLQWSTASEINNDHFTLERSTDGISWTTAKTIQGAGNSNRRINYSASDETSSDKTYYRLQQTDLQGNFVYSSIIQISCSGSSALETVISPNISSGMFMIQNAPAGGEFEIIDVAGNIIRSQKITDINQSLDLQDLSNGMYVLALRSDNGISSHKLMVQH